MAKAKQHKMNPKIKRQWIKALRSGKYKQVAGQLKEQRFKDPYYPESSKELKPSFCCLGVLCDLYEKKNPSMWDGESFVVKKGDLQSSVLPKEVMKWAGLKSPTGIDGLAETHFDGDSSLDNLADLNDTAQWGFKKIATFIEKNL